MVLFLRKYGCIKCTFSSIIYIIYIYILYILKVWYCTRNYVAGTIPFLFTGYFLQ